MTLIMVSVIQKLSPHYSLAKWFLCSTGLLRFLHPTDNELKTLAGMYRLIEEIIARIARLFFFFLFSLGIDLFIQLIGIFRCSKNDA